VVLGLEALLLAAVVGLLVGAALGVWWGRRTAPLVNDVGHPRVAASPASSDVSPPVSRVDEARLHALEAAVESLTAQATKARSVSVALPIAAAGAASAAASASASASAAAAVVPPASVVVTERAAAALMDPDIFKPSPPAAGPTGVSDLTPLGLRLIEPDTIRPGTKNLLVGPVHGTPDDLTLIRGVASDTVQALHHIGVYYHWQIAAWTADDAAQVEALLKTTQGRIQRDAWVAQSAQFVG
jgi:hypothetical protein